MDHPAKGQQPCIDTRPCSSPHRPRSAAGAGGRRRAAARSTTGCARRRPRRRPLETGAGGLHRRSGPPHVVLAWPSRRAAALSGTHARVLRRRRGDGCGNHRMRRHVHPRQAARLPPRAGRPAHDDGHPADAARCTLHGAFSPGAVRRPRRVARAGHGGMPHERHHARRVPHAARQARRLRSARAHGRRVRVGRQSGRPTSWAPAPAP